jgi:hypothetical protein
MVTVPPIVMGLLFADRVLLDPQSSEYSLIGLFQGKAYAAFPTPPVKMVVFLTVAGGRGDGEFELSVYQLDENGDHAPNRWIYRKRKACVFPSDDPNRVVEFDIPTKSLCFPKPGDYLFAVSLEGKPVAERRLLVRME